MLVLVFVIPKPGPEPYPETSNVVLNMFQDQGLSNSGSMISGSRFCV